MTKYASVKATVMCFQLLRTENVEQNIKNDRFFI